MTTTPQEKELTPGSLYIIGFAQGRTPYAALFLPTSASGGIIFHISDDGNEYPFWTYQIRRQRIAGDMFCTTLLKLHDVADGGPITIDQLQECAAQVPVPEKSDAGECLAWVLGVVEELRDRELLEVASVEALGGEFEEFSASNNACTRCTMFPNERASSFCF